ncbi:MAG: hypothetical protein J7L58_04765 [Thermoplasmata archaeon]|nr:hypothetical protein [Thermoplasmata archaeon]
MLKFIRCEKRGDVSWLMSQIALLIAVGILLASISSLAFYSDWRKKAEIDVIAMQIAKIIDAAEVKDYPGRIKYMLPDKNYDYEVFLSTDYIVVKRYDGRMNKEIVATKELHTRPWINPPMSGGKGADGIYNYFGSIYGIHHNGANPDSKLPAGVLEGEMEIMANELAKNPFKIDCEKPLYVEKIFIYVEGGNAKSLVLIYQ